MSQANTPQAGRDSRWPQSEMLTFADAVRMAVENPSFAEELCPQPEKFKTIFGLNDQQVHLLSTIEVSEFAQIRENMIRDPQTFEENVEATERFLKAHLSALSDFEQDSTEIYEA